MFTTRLAFLGGLCFLAGACTPVTDYNWRTAGLGKDPLVHGPFLIGASRPAVGTNCVRPGAVRSQDARAEWIPCRNEVLLPPPTTPVVTVEPLPPAGSYVEAAPPLPPARLPSRSRSAWDG